MGHAQRAEIALEYDALFCLINNEDVTWFCMYTVTNNGTGGRIVSYLLVFCIIMCHI
jgi:hypothetical protein